VALTIALDLVIKYRLRLADSRDSRLVSLGATYELAAASWTGPRAALVAFYEPPSDPVTAGHDLAARCEGARRWGRERLEVQGAQTCDVLLIALRPVIGTLSAAASNSEPVRIGAAWIDAEAGNADALLPIPPGLPTVGELRARVRDVRGGAPVPTLAAVDLAERQMVAGGYVAPVRQQMVTQPYVTYGLVASFVLIYILEKALIPTSANSTGPDLYDFGALANVGNVDWWRFTSSAFLHDNLSYAHILFNGLAMFWIGRIVEQLYGRLVLLGTFLLTAVAGSVLWWGISHLGFNITTPGISIGASGGISGLVGLLLMLGRVQGRNVPAGIAHSIRNYAIIVIALNVFFGFFFVGVNNLAHLGGLLAGAAVGAILPPIQRIGGRDLNSVEKSALGGVIAVSAVALLLAIVNLVSVLAATPSLG
jgi:membrane associated rhomboid family serine protease